VNLDAADHGRPISGVDAQLDLGHLGSAARALPDCGDESTRAAVDAVITVRAEQQRNSGNATTQRRGSRPE